MAIGLSKMFSISLTLNFARPYASLFVDEFWRRWHITLTTWFKDYVYKPFCRLFEFSASATVIGAIIVFTFTGLWYGFGLRFLIWSSVHCILVLVSKLAKRRLNLDSPRMLGTQCGRQFFCQSTSCGSFSSMTYLTLFMYTNPHFTWYFRKS